MKKSFLEQFLFVCGSLLTCAVILASSRMDLPAIGTNLGSQLGAGVITARVESLASGLTFQLAVGLENSSTLTASPLVTRISNQLAQQLSNKLPPNWVAFLNSSALADLRDRAIRSRLDVRPTTENSAMLPLTACSVEEVQHILQGEMSPMIDLALQRGLRSELLSTESLSPIIDRSKIEGILASIHTPTLFASSVSAVGANEVAAIVITEHRCVALQNEWIVGSPVESKDDSSAEAQVGVGQKMSIDPESREATIERNDAPSTGVQNVAALGLGI